MDGQQLTEQDLVEIEKRARCLPRPNQKDIFNLLLAVRTLKAANQGDRLSPTEITTVKKIREQREQKKKNLRRELIRIAEDLGTL